MLTATKPQSAAATQLVTDAAKASEPKQVQTVQAPISNQPAQPESKPADILQRAASEPAKETPKVDIPQLGNLDDIKDPAVKKMLEDKYKEWASGFNKKFELLAEERKTLEKEREALRQNQDWTPDRINQLLSDPKFVQSAQTLAESKAPGQWQGSEEEWSALAPHEKQAFKQMQSKLAQQDQQLQSLMLQQSQQQVREIDTNLKTKYPDFDAEQINQFAKRYDAGDVTTEELRKLVYLGLNAERLANNSYQLGLKDRNSSVQEKMQASSPFQGNSVSLSENKPVMQQDEKPKDFFVRLSKWNLAQLKQGKKL